jgi:hypothetical protein
VSVLKTQLEARALVESQPDTVRRFWRRLRCPPLRNACWSWKGRIDQGRPPSLAVRGRQVQAARIAHLAVTGEWPLAFRWIRSCDNPLCVRPSHGRWHVGTTTRRTLDSMELGFVEVLQTDLATLELEAAQRAGIIDELWDTDGDSGDLSLSEPADSMNESAV